MWNPATRKMVVSRDIDFPQPGDNKDNNIRSKPIQRAPTSPKDLYDDDKAAKISAILTNKDDNKQHH